MTKQETANLLFALGVTVVIFASIPTLKQNATGQTPGPQQLNKTGIDNLGANAGFAISHCRIEANFENMSIAEQEECDALMRYIAGLCQWYNVRGFDLDFCGSPIVNYMLTRGLAPAPPNQLLDGFKRFNTVANAMLNRTN